MDEQLQAAEHHGWNDSALLQVKFPPPKDLVEDPIPDVAKIHRQLKDLYLQDDRPWIVGYSGGKDSTATLQLVYYTLRHLPPDERRKPVYVLCSDTLVETPPIIEYIKTSLAQIQQAGQVEGLPITATLVEPELEDSFWVSLIGKGYPSPNRWFRWCTERLKIRPANKFILEQVSQFGEVIVVLGVRRAESATRAQSLQLHRLEGTALRRHASLPNAYVYAPIEDWSTDAVWTYLLQVPSPWGGNNRALVTLYRSAHSGECPLVIDTTTPSCGNSRFGCWTCTVVSKDHSMEGFIESGQEWLQPMLDLRNWLAEIRNDPEKRSYKRRTGEEGLGPFTLETRREILRRLLEAQKAVDHQLIKPKEVERIHAIWTQEGDWQGGVTDIVGEAALSHLGPAHPESERGYFGPGDEVVLRRLCETEGVPPDLVKRLLQAEREAAGLARRRGIYERIHAILDEAWMTEEEVTAHRAAAMEVLNAPEAPHAA